MNTVLILCMFVSVPIVRAHNVRLSESQKDKVHKHTMICVKESGVKPEALANAKRGQFDDDEAFKKFLLCFLMKSHIINKEGSLDPEAVVMKLPKDADKEGVKRALLECKDKMGKDTADRAFEMFKCYYNKTPTHVIF